jgi:nitrite reductase/ring-hydroxylating ferredoxin subunit
MTDSQIPDPAPSAEAPQELVGFMSNEDWQDLLSDVNGRINEMEELAFPQVKEQVFELLAGIDIIHREALHRLVRLFKENVMEQVVTDPAIHTLMELYDLLPPTVERATPVDFKFEFGGGAKPAPAPSRGPVAFPHWVPALKNADVLEEGTTIECHVDNRILMLVRMEGKFYAFDSACVQGDGDSLKDGSLSRYTLSCPHHTGCHYDIRNGGQIGGNKAIECYNVKKDDGGRLMVGIDMEFRPLLPAF